MRAEYDRRADALYVYVVEGVVESTQEISPDLIVDLDANGQLVGIELLSPQNVDVAPLLDLHPVDGVVLRSAIDLAIGARVQQGASIERQTGRGVRSPK